MARARNIKPGFFTDAELVDCEIWVRMLFAGLWTLADREGRLLDKPKQIGLDLFPRDRLDIDAGLNDLAEHGLIVRYAVNGVQIIQVKNFAKHQNPHRDERASILPAQGFAGDSRASTEEAPGFIPENTVQDAMKHDGNLADSLPLIPDSSLLIPDPGLHDAPPTPPPGDVVQTPYAMWAVFCETAGYDIKAATPQERGRSLATAKRLIEGGVTVQEVAGCTRYLGTQSWRTGVLSLAGVANEIGKWRMAGKPAQERARGSPGKATGKSYVELAKEADERDARRNGAAAATHPRSLLAGPEGRGERPGAATGDLGDDAGAAIDAGYRIRAGPVVRDA
jgi:hypothetical protein